MPRNKALNVSPGKDHGLPWKQEVVLAGASINAGVVEEIKIETFLILLEVEGGELSRGTIIILQVAPRDQIVALLKNLAPLMRP